MTTIVYDIDGNEQTLDWLRDEWDGCQVLPARILDGVTEYWKLKEVHCTTGLTVLTIETRKGTASADNQEIVMTFPLLENSSDELPDLPANQYNWAPRGVLQRTGENGKTDFGLGTIFGPYYHAWVLSSAPSDCLSRTGMQGGTPCDGPLHGVWMLTPIGQ